MSEGSERRQHPRVIVRFHDIQLKDADREASLGAVANLSHNGLMVNSSRHFGIGETIRARLCWKVVGDAEVRQMHIGIDAMWSSPTSDGEASWTGFQIVDINETDQQQLDLLVLSEAN